MSRHLILVIDGPLQSWGGTAPFWPERPTETMPTLSGIAGLIANALGRDRKEPLDGLADAEMHVRADRLGQRIEDYHTIGGGDPDGGILQTNQRNWLKRSDDAMITRRHYLADAAYVIHWTPGPGLEAATVAAALNAPRRPLYLGRRSCPPALPPLLSLTDLTPEEAFQTLPLLAEPHTGHVPSEDYFGEVAGSGTTLHIPCQSPGQPGDPNTEVRYDVPVTFDPAQRWQQASHRWIRNYSLPFISDQCAGRGRRGRSAMLEAIQKGEAA